MVKGRPDSAESGISTGYDRDQSDSPGSSKTNSKKAPKPTGEPQETSPLNMEASEPVEDRKKRKKKKKKAKNTKSKPENAEENKEGDQPPAAGTGQPDVTGETTAGQSETSKPEMVISQAEDQVQGRSGSGGSNRSRGSSGGSKGALRPRSTLSLNSLSSRSSFGLWNDWDISAKVLRHRPELEVEFVDGLDEKHECPVCCQVLRYPVQFEECGHRCCSSCLPELLRVAPRCPIDQTVIERDKIYVDKVYQKEIDNLAVKCSNHARGCKWASTLNELTNHNEECNYTLVPCPKDCDAEFERRFLNRHVKNDCPNRDIECDFCQAAIKQKDEVDHLKECAFFPVPCPNGCKKKEILRGELAQHIEMECPKQDIECPFAEAGCQFKCSRKEMDKHMRETPEVHLEYVGRTLKLYKEVLEEHKEVLDNQTERLVTVENKVESLEKLYGAQLVWKIDNYNDKVIDAKSGKKTTIYSPPFLSSRHGYKMVLSMCLYGDGKARGKHMSLFICIMKGEYDALLPWPFCHRVTFTLIDQCQNPSARRNITYSVKPNICKENKPFLGRPIGERNASFGAQKFVEIDVMNSLDYIRDDVIYIKVHVDNEEMTML